MGFPVLSACEMLVLAVLFLVQGQHVATRHLVPYSAEWARQRFPNGELSDCVWAKVRVPGLRHRFEMCTYPKRFDVWLSRRIQDSGCFECDLVSMVLHQMTVAQSTVYLQGQHAEQTAVKQRKQDLGCALPRSDLIRIGTPLLLDIGGNIGMYSLAAAAACFEAIAFEPVPLNAYKFMASIQRNNFTGWAKVYTIGASDAYEVFDMGLSEANQGETMHIPFTEGSDSKPGGGGHTLAAL